MQAVRNVIQTTTQIRDEVIKYYYSIFTGVTKREKLNMQVEYIKAPVQILISNDGLLQWLITKMRTR